MRRLHTLLLLLFVLTWSSSTLADERWITSWAASAQGPYPAGYPGAQQPDLATVFPDPARGAVDQSFRLIIRPDLWGRELRLRLSNAFGTRPVTFEAVYVGLQHSAAEVVAGTNQPVRFGGAGRVTVAPGQWVWSDAVALPFVRDPADPLLAGRRLAVSLHVAGESGPMTWHAKAMYTSYVSLPGSGAQGAVGADTAFPASAASWFFLDAVDVKAPADTRLVVCFGDSITDGSASTMNGDDRWPDVLSRRLHARFGNRVAVVNAGIGGNRVATPADYAPQAPFPGGPAAPQRLERDVLGLSGVATVIWLEGINDFSLVARTDAATVMQVMREQVARLRGQVPGVRVIGATVVSALGSSRPNYGAPQQDASRRELNAFIRDSGVFDGVADFDRATLDADTGRLRAAFVPDSNGGAGDGLHPNRRGYMAMGQAVDLDLLLPGMTPAGGQ